MFLSAMRKISPNIGSSVDRDSSPLAGVPRRRSQLQTDEILGLSKPHLANTQRRRRHRKGRYDDHGEQPRRRLLSAGCACRGLAR